MAWFRKEKKPRVPRRERLEIPVVLFDERFTTDLAQQAPTSDAPLDARAAAHLLSSYLAWSSAAPA